MSRSQGAANGGWQRSAPSCGRGRSPHGWAPRTASAGSPVRATARHRQNPAYPQQGYGEQQQAPAYGQQAYHYPQQPQYAPPQAPAPAAPPVNRQGLSSLDSARNAQPTQDFDNYPRTQPPA